MTVILVTGFGPFPGAPYNPTGPLARRMGRLRRPALADVKVIAHVFPTSYGAVDRELPELIARHRPDALLMFGLHGRSRTLRIETRARNALAMLPDASRQSLRRNKIVPGGLPAIAMPAPVRHLLAATRGTRLPVTLSRDAGRYLCNYLCWRAAEAVAAKGGPRLAVFVHIPAVARSARRRRAGKPRLSLGDLTRAGTRILTALSAATRR